MAFRFAMMVVVVVVVVEDEVPLSLVADILRAGIEEGRERITVYGGTPGLGGAT